MENLFINLKGFFYCNKFGGLKNKCTFVQITLKSNEMRNVKKISVNNTYNIFLYNSTQEISISTSGNIVNGSALNNDFINISYRFTGHKKVRLNKVLESDKSVKDIFGYYHVDGWEKLDTVEALITYLSKNEWIHEPEKTWVIYPIVSKQINGKSFDIEFCLYGEDFEKELKKYVLPVKMSNITKTSKSCTFRMYIPDHIYNVLMRDLDESRRPSQNVIECASLSGIHSIMNQYNDRAYEILEYERDCENTDKFIGIDFASKNTNTRNEWQHGFTGNMTKISFKYYIIYAAKNRATNYSNRKYFTFQYFSGTEIQTSDKKRFLSSDPQVVIKWTEEREKYLFDLDIKFKSMANNLNAFLSEINEDSFNMLMESSTPLKLVK